MANALVIFALRGKYARVLGEAIVHEREAARLRSLLANIEVSIALFDARIATQSIKPIRPRKPSRWGNRGGGVRIYLDILRRADRPLTSLEIAKQAAAFDSHGDGDKARIKLLVGPINKSLGLREGKGIIRHASKPVRWSLMPPVANTLPIDG
jgi:hypothetical protein